MKKVFRTIGNVAVAIAVAASMFANVQVSALAADADASEPVATETTVTGAEEENKEEAPAESSEEKKEETKEEAPVAKKDTIYINFKEENPQIIAINKMPNGPEDFATNNYSTSEKNAFLIAMLNASCSAFGSNEDGVIVLGENKEITVNVDDVNISVDAGNSTGKFETTVSKKDFDKTGDMPDSFDPVETLCDIFDLDKDVESFKIEITFADEKTEEPTTEEPKTEEPTTEEPKTEEVTPAPTNSDDKKAAETVKDEKKEESAKVAVGTDFVDNGYSYKVTAADEVTFAGSQNKALKAVNIPDSVVYQGTTFKVTAIADKALFGNKKVTSVTVGKNVKTIGASAFAKCGKLKNVKIDATNLEKIGKKAFNKNSKKLVVKIHKASFKSYKKLFKKAKLSKIKLKKIK